MLVCFRPRKPDAVLPWPVSLGNRRRVFCSRTRTARVERTKQTSTIMPVRVAFVTQAVSCDQSTSWLFSLPLIQLTKGSSPLSKLSCDLFAVPNLCALMLAPFHKRQGSYYRRCFAPGTVSLNQAMNKHFLSEATRTWPPPTYGLDNCLRKVWARDNRLNIKMPTLTAYIAYPPVASLARATSSSLERWRRRHTSGRSLEARWTPLLTAHLQSPSGSLSDPSRRPGQQANPRFMGAPSRSEA